MGFYSSYKAVLDAVVTAVDGKSSIGTVVLGEQFTVGALPKAVINALPSPVLQASLDGVLEVHVAFSVILVILEYEPNDWFADIVTVMGDAVDAVLADVTLGGKALNVYPTLFSPGEIKFKDKVYYGGQVNFEAVLLYDP